MNASIGATLGLISVMIIVVVRAIKGPTIFDRLLAVNTFGTLTVLLIAVAGFLTDRPEFLDISIVYALINFIGTIAVLNYMNLHNTPEKEGQLPSRGDKS